MTSHIMLSCKRFVKPLLAADAMLVSSEKLGGLLHAGHILSPYKMPATLLSSQLHLQRLYSLMLIADILYRRWPVQ
jgi:hypothetical protein